MTLETPAIMTETAGPFRGLTPTASIADIDARIRRVAGGHLAMTDLAIDDIIDILLVLARRLAPYVDVQHLAGVIIDLDAEVLDADDIEDDDITHWCSLYVDHTLTGPR